MPPRSEPSPESGIEQRISILKESAHIASNVMEELSSHLHPGVSETEIAALVPKLFAQYGGEQVEPPLILFGARTATAIDEPNSGSVLKKGDLVLLDVIGGKDGMGADLTRMFNWGEPSEVVKDYFKFAKKRLDKNIYRIK